MRSQLLEHHMQLGAYLKFFCLNIVLEPSQNVFWRSGQPLKRYPMTGLLTKGMAVIQLSNNGVKTSTSSPDKSFLSPRRLLKSKMISRAHVCAVLKGTITESPVTFSYTFCRPTPFCPVIANRRSSALWYHAPLLWLTRPPVLPTDGHAKGGNK
ncbi:hypothetical protein PSH58_14210 [Pseudomonas hefeiensis]|uniref:Uncharacterized protein n=1 Tax=Pseudomonas hefeiensis TaxID=2738125 RepID=A0ABY9GJN0_9PSED|nr:MULTISPECIES: hypothetical protein [unclassified Pseudomonas]WLH15373.1 hypothetical protein PSH57_14185 [Pseudomonas sp. FP205]WLH98424.1 hypothetical protein PSH58_14210 [Pseudomonas sp. FP53]WLI42686.1 hypothetical protein PSH74_14140 [Pseudomonas sp. FP821]